MPAQFATQAVWLLRIALLIVCIAQAATYVFDPLAVDSPAYEMLVRGLDADPLKASRLADQAHLAALGAAIAIVFVPLLLLIGVRSNHAGADRWPWTVWQLPVLLALAAWNVLFVVADAFVGGGAMNVAAAACASVPRVVVPLALFALCFRHRQWTSRANSVRTAIEILRIGAVAAFASLGWFGVNFDPALVDAVLGTAQNVLGWAMSEDVADLLVCGTGVVSAALAVFLLFFRWQGAAVAMAIIAAGWFVVGLGEGGLSALRYLYPEVLLRTATVATPCALLLLERSRVARANVQQDENPDEELVIVGAADAG